MARGAWAACMVRCAAARARGGSLVGLAETLDSKSCRDGHLPTVSGRSRGAPDGSRAGASGGRAERRVVGPVVAIFGLF